MNRIHFCTQTTGPTTETGTGGGHCILLRGQEEPTTQGPTMDVAGGEVGGGGRGTAERYMAGKDRYQDLAQERGVDG